MLYRVKAKYDEQKAAKFYEKLTDGSIMMQKPDGPEIVASMKRAKITSPGTIEWYETCYCTTPLQHERETVYDFFLTQIEAEEVNDDEDISGESFWNHLKETADK